MRLFLRDMTAGTASSVAAGTASAGPVFLIYIRFIDQSPTIKADCCNDDHIDHTNTSLLEDGAYAACTERFP